LTIAVAKKQTRLTQHEKENVIQPSVLFFNLAVYLYASVTFATEFGLSIPITK